MNDTFPMQMDYCDTCLELKKQIHRAKRSFLHMMANGCGSAVDIESKQKVLYSYEFLLLHHHHLPAEEQKEYKKSFACSFDFSLLIISMLFLWLIPTPKVVRVCDFQKSRLNSHCRQSAPLGKTYHYQNIMTYHYQNVMYHVFGKVDASQRKRYVRVIYRTAAGENTPIMFSLISLT